LNFGSWNAGFWILDFGFWILDFGFWILDFGFRIKGFAFKVERSGFRGIVGLRVSDLRSWVRCIGFRARCLSQETPGWS